MYASERRNEDDLAKEFEGEDALGVEGKGSGGVAGAVAESHAVDEAGKGR